MGEYIRVLEPVKRRGEGEKIVELKEPRWVVEVEGEKYIWIPAIGRWVHIDDLPKLFSALLNHYRRMVPDSYRKGVERG